MESIIARALEYTLKYWLKSFSRDQFKLYGRTAQLSNLDINGDALHSSMGLPPALNVTTAKVGKLEIMLPYVSNVQWEPIVVQIDRLDLVLEENQDLGSHQDLRCTQSSTSSAKGGGYGFADKIADGMTLQVGTVNLLIETRGARGQGGATWASPLASITMRNLLLYTTNENWQVVNLKEARDFSNGKNFIYVFKKLEWESLSVDLLPHPDMFMNADAAWSEDGKNKRDDDGAKRVFFGGERFIEGISGEAYITIQRTEANCPLGLEVQLHVTEAVCPALSEPGLRALLRFMTGFYVCLNRGDVDPKAQQRSTEAAGRSLVSVLVDHIFLCIKDAGFQLELLMQSLFFSRASASNGEKAKCLTQVTVGGFFLRDTFSHPPCTLVQPSMHNAAKDFGNIPYFAKNFSPPIYPLGNQQWQLNNGVPLICLHSLQFNPSPAPPTLASQTVIECQPLMVHLQEESCLRIASFLADGIVGSPGAVVSESSVNSLRFNLRELDLTVPVDIAKLDISTMSNYPSFRDLFTGARLHIKDLFFSESPSLKLELLALEKDPACFCLWEGQPVDASSRKWRAGASELSLSLEMRNKFTEIQNSFGRGSDFWSCVVLKDTCIEAAMATADGTPLTDIPPPGGIVRVGFACQEYLSNTSVEQLFFVLDLYAYFGTVGENIVTIGKKSRRKKRQEDSTGETWVAKAPSDTAGCLAVKDLQLRFLDSSHSSIDIQGLPLVEFVGKELCTKVAHKTLGGAVVVSSTVRWDSVEVGCVDVESNLRNGNHVVLDLVEDGLGMDENAYPQLRAVFWIHNHQASGTGRVVPFLDINMVHVIPYVERDRGGHSLSVSGSVAGVRLGGGMNYAEALLHRFGILGPDGGPSEGLSKGLNYLSSGPLSKLFKASSPIAVDQEENGSLEDQEDSSFLHLGKPDDVDVIIEFKDWLFALEGTDEVAERLSFNIIEDSCREERCWHTSFETLQVKAKSGLKNSVGGTKTSNGMREYPVDSVTVSVDGLQAVKPHLLKAHQNGLPLKVGDERDETFGGINLEVYLALSDDNVDDETAKWAIENLKFSVKKPIEAVATKDELQHLAFLCKSEVDSAGRIAAGLLRVLKLEKSIGKAAIDQLSNLGSEGVDKIFSPDRLSGSRDSSTTSFGLTTPPANGEVRNLALESTVASLEEALLDSQARCASLAEELDGQDLSLKHLAQVKQLSQKLENMQGLLEQMRTQLQNFTVA
ncbi:Vacuolar protein sorting-associated protein 13-like, N-terminal domain [Dillenia turbinata]|uniref:Vacuolar protein sorting-associated protein 13-like, N-terminal domain n=1 Tax=Dillenia turbinata TaxID=194707 RepID=A0AAN8WHX1_9MAGN